jgi:hypothetical protein
LQQPINKKNCGFVVFFQSLHGPQQEPEEDEETAATVERIIKDDPRNTNYGEFYVSLRNYINSFSNILLKKILAQFQLFLEEFDKSIQNQILNSE